MKKTANFEKRPTTKEKTSKESVTKKKLQEFLFSNGGGGLEKGGCSQRGVELISTE